MSGCCTPGAYGEVFSERSARRDARRYRKKGLDATARRIVDFLVGAGLEGGSVLEAGGGVGAIQVELLRGGVGRTVNVELSPAYEASALELLREHGLEGRAERLLLDFAREGESLGPADAVVMHRVVCCYPDVGALVGMAASRTRRYLVMSFPRDTLAMRSALAAMNVWLMLTRREFRVFVHAPSTILAAAALHGLRPALEHRGRLWQLVALAR